MKRIVLLSVVLIGSLISCSLAKKQKGILIISKWKMIKIEVLDKSGVSERDLRAINDPKYYSENELKFQFESNNRFRMFERGRENENKFEYKLVDSMNTPNSNGNFIYIDSYNKDGSLYDGTNKPGPYEIIKISDTELVLKELDRHRYNDKSNNLFKDELKKHFKKEENFLRVFERVEENN